MTPPVRFLHARVAGGPLYLRARTASRAVFCVGGRAGPALYRKNQIRHLEGVGGGGCHMLAQAVDFLPACRLRCPRMERVSTSRVGIFLALRRFVLSHYVILNV